LLDWREEVVPRDFKGRARTSFHVWLKHGAA